jgi:hypothetical protein
MSATRTLRRERALELIDVDNSWKAFFLGKSIARYLAGFTNDEVKAIEQQNNDEKLAYDNRRNVFTNTTPYLCRKSKELEYLDSSWKVAYFCYDKISMRENAGFSCTEIADIKRFRKDEHSRLLRNPEHLSKRAEKRDRVDKTWGAFLIGKDVARINEGFMFDENEAIDKYIASEPPRVKPKEESQSYLSCLSCFFSPKKQIKQQQKMIIKERQIKRKINQSLCAM